MTMRASLAAHALLSAASYAPSKNRDARTHGLRAAAERSTQVVDLDAGARWHGTCDDNGWEGALMRLPGAARAARGWNLRSRLDFQ